MSPSAGSAPDTTPPATRRAAFSRIPAAVWLFVAISIYFVASLALSWLRAVELQATTWDLGLYQQALWSTAHGRPFFEAADLETGGYHSLLQVHSVFLLYLVVPLYNLVPSEITLFALQSAAVAGAAIPLYLLAKDLTRSPRLALGCAILFLAATPVLSANLFDFHAEAFLPLELFGTVLCWQRGRYRIGAVLAAASYATFELAPVILFFVGVYFLLPSSSAWKNWSARRAIDSGWAGWLGGLRALVSSRRVQASLALAAASLAAYFLLLFLRVDVLSSALGTTPLAVPVSGYVIGDTPASLGLSLSNIGIGFGAKAVYWLLLLALLGFVPLLAPRALVLSLPWFVFTFLSSNLNYVVLGFQYGFIAAAPLFVAFAYALPRLVRLLERDTMPLPESKRSGLVDSKSPWLRQPRRTLFFALATLIAVNLALSPANPVMQDHGLGGGYQVEYDPPAGFAAVQRLAALIPTDESVIASNNLFPLVANRAQAYSFFFEPNNFLLLPFNATDLPEYVFLDATEISSVPVWLGWDLYAPGSFGVRGVAWSSPTETVLLFERAYSGAPVEFGSPAAFPEVILGPAIADAEAGYVTTSPMGDGPNVAASAPGTVGTFFFGPGTALPGGPFTVQLSIHAEPAAGLPSPSPTEPVLWIEGAAFAQTPYFVETLDWQSLDSSGWKTVELNFTSPGPILDFTVEGNSVALNAQIFLASVVVAPS